MYLSQAVRRLKQLVYILIAILLLLTLASGVSASVRLQDVSPDGVWYDVPEKAIAVQGERLIVPTQYRTVGLYQSALYPLLAAAPREGNVTAQASTAIITLPLPDGSYGRFSLVESPIMVPELAAKFPEIKTYAGQGIDDKTATVRFDWTPAGFHALILSANGTVYIDPYSRNDTTHYVSYYARDYRSLVPKGWSEVLPESPEDLAMAREIEQLRAQHPDTPTGPQLRTYRLAVAATGEYTIFHGGTVPAGMAAIVTSVNRVDGVYEREVAVRMVLVANNNLLVYTDPNTDPYTNNSGSTMLGENQTNIDNVIGNANYDVGHVFSTGGGGVAYLGVPCRAGFKARGVTGSSSPVGDPFDIDYVAHEMGHQFGANHSFNGNAGSCSGGNRNGSTAYEPGSGSTIMAYAGICGAQDLQPHSDDYFHTISFDEIVAYTNFGSGNSCPVTTNTSNSAPVPNAGPGGYMIPAQTPFTLVGSATDPDGDPLTYNWEEFDLGAAGAPNNPTNPPFFRSFNSTTSPARTFPKWTDILSNTSTIGEILPNTTQAMTFRLTARDNRSGGGGVDRTSATINVTTAAGPFQVTAPNTVLTWTVGSVQNVTWNVANTNLAPVNCSTVNVRLSTDGGFNYPIALASGVANNGTIAVTVPNNTTTQARVQVACANNIFFDVSNANFSIVIGAPDFGLTLDPATQSICAPANAVYSVTVSSLAGFNTPVTLTSSAIAGTTAGFTPNPVTPPGMASFTIGNTGAAVAGRYPITLTGQAGVLSHSVPSLLNIFTSAPTSASLVTPTNGAVNQLVRPTFSWSAPSQAGTYDIQIATDAGFTNIVAGATDLLTTAFTPTTDLNSNTIYYWRVRSANACGVGAYSAVYTFTTLARPGDCTLGLSPSVLYSTDFESGAGAWTHSGTGDTWSLWSTSVHSGTNAFHATDPTSVSDQRLVSPPVVLPSGQNPLTLQFWNKQMLEHNISAGCYDGGLLEISTNGGTTWTQINNANLLTDPYDGSISTSFANPLAGSLAWCGDPQNWLNSIVDVSAYAGQTVQFRFRLGSDSSTGSADGWNIDDVKVQSCLTPAQADLSLSKSVTPTTVLNGDLVTYTLTITNNGPDAAANAVLSDVLPVSVTFQSLSTQPGWTCTTPTVGSSGLVKCTHPSLVVGSTSFTLLAQITGVHTLLNTIITNQIAATTSTLDPALPNSASASVTVSGVPDFQVYLPIVMRDF